MKMLIENYRSHEMIIELPSQMFYLCRLKAALPLEEQTELCSLDWLPNRVGAF